MASSSIPLGPPSASADTSLVKPASTDQPEPSVSDDSSLIAKTASLNLEEEESPPKGLTENLSDTFYSTGSPCLDFFFHVVPDTPPNVLIQSLATSWSHDPLTTLKLVANLRGVRGTGRSDKEGFYTAAFWLHENHPKTLALNLPALVEFGYFKDLPEILYRILEGQQMERGESRVWRKRNERGSTVHADKTEARVLRKQRELEKKKRALEKYNSDGNYRLLFDKVADLFADSLKSDLECLNSNEFCKISLASKWCPSLDSSYDKTTLICEAIARRLCPREEVYRIRDRLRKEVLVPLRKALELPEVSMSAKKWDSLKYDKVASVAMKNYKKLFEEHDKERFEEYLKDVKSGRAKMAAGALLPHEIIHQLEYDGDVGAEVAELQWQRMVDDVSKKGKMKNSLAICDVSGSMEGIPLKVCVALGLLVSELNEEPWKGKVITFSKDPELHVVQGSSLREKTEFVKKMEWGYTTNFQKVFDRILEVAVENNLSNDQMIKRLFVFSDMEFDMALDDEEESVDYDDVDADELEEETEEEKEMFKQWAKEKWETDYEAVKRKYKESGFENVPEMVFWNLRESAATPVVAKEKGVALVSGFSKNLLTMFLEEDETVDPEDVILLATRGEEYKKLVVYD